MTRQIGRVGLAYLISPFFSSHDDDDEANGSPFAVYMENNYNITSRGCLADVEKACFKGLCDEACYGSGCLSHPLCAPASQLHTRSTACPYIHVLCLLFSWKRATGRVTVVVSGRRLLHAIFSSCSECCWLVGEARRRALARLQCGVRRSRLNAARRWRRRVTAGRQLDFPRPLWEACSVVFLTVNPRLFAIYPSRKFAVKPYCWPKYSLYWSTSRLQLLVYKKVDKSSSTASIAVIRTSKHFDCN